MPAGALLELVEQLGGPQLRRSRHRPGREAGGDRVDRVAARKQLTLDRADELVHVRVALDREQLG